MTDAQAMLYVHMDPPPDEDAFNRWYNEDHAPARLRVPGFLVGRRYRSISTDGPRYMACYDLADASVLQSPEYLGLRAVEIPRDRDFMATIPLNDRRVYRAINVGDPGTEPWTEHAPYVLSVALEPPADQVEDFHAWYREEHIPMLLRVPGWRRIRRFELIDGDAPRFLALHELDSIGGFETDVYKAALSTPWRLRVSGAVVRRERSLFELIRGFNPPA